MNHQFDLMVIGGITWDSIAAAGEATVLEEAGRRYLAYPYDEKVDMEQASFGFGGGGANVSVAAARLGLKVSLTGAVGTDRIGETILQHLAGEGVAVKHVKKDPKQPTGISIVLGAPDAERTILLYRGANSHLTHRDISWQHCHDADWLYVSSLSGESDRLYNEVARVAKHDGMKLALNPGSTQIHRGPKGLHTALESADVLLLNEEEARELLRQRGKKGETVQELLRALQKITQGVVVITQGSEGAQAADGRYFYAIGAFGNDRVNTLGAGDAFGSTFVTALSKEMTVPEALRHASVNAAAVVADYSAEEALLDLPTLEKRVHAAKDFQVDVTDASA